jgi:hypothetical protein
MAKLRRLTISKNKRTQKWDLRTDGDRRLIHSFKKKENAKKGGVLKKILGKKGGSVKFEFERKSGYDEERTYPGSRDPKSSPG